MKKRILVLSLIALLLSLCVTGTLAYFTVEETETNVITAGNIDIDLIETDAKGRPFRDVCGVVPGAKIDKIVNVKNVSDNPCWVRVSVKKAIYLAFGVRGIPNPSLVKINFNNTEWIEKDGYYYYKEPLLPGETTKAPLFTQVTFDKAMNNLYEGSKAIISVCAHAVQSANNAETVLEVKGWPEP